MQAVGVAFEIVEALADAKEPVGVSDLARRTGHTKARVHRHIVTLRELGFVEKDASSDRYRLSWKIHRLGMSVAESFGLRRLAQRHLMQLAQTVRQTVVLAAPAGDSIAIVETVESDSDFAITVRRGSTIDPISSALGRTILAFEDEAAVELSLKAHARGPRGKKTLSRSVLVEHLERIREKWYEVATGERLAGIAALACPVFNHNDKIAGAIAVVAHDETFGTKALPTLIHQVQDAARAISGEFRSTAWQTAGK